jgi:hypothetical protein
MPQEKNQGMGAVVLLLLVIAVLQAISLYLQFRPAYHPVYQVLSPAQEKTLKENTALLKEVSALTSLPNTEPAIAEVLDVELLKNEHQINGEVYKDAQNGDKVIGYEDRLIIYRPSEKKIVYDGKNPNQILNEQYLAALQDVLGKVSALTTLDSKAVPQFSIIGDVTKLQAQNPNVFAKAQNGDSLLLYENRFIIYRASSNELIYDADVSEGVIGKNKLSE